MRYFISGKNRINFEVAYNHSVQTDIPDRTKSMEDDLKHVSTMSTFSFKTCRFLQFKYKKMM